MITVHVNNEVNLKGIKTATKKVMTQVGFTAIGVIRDRTEKGKDYAGRAFKPYSKSPALFPIAQRGPGGSAAKMRTFYRRQQKWVRKRPSQSTAKWVWLPGGYRQYRQIQGRKTQRVDLTFSGRMLGNLRVKRARARNVLIGFTGEQARKAYYHSVSGAGTARVRRVFMRITRQKELRKLRDVVARNIDREIRRASR